MKFVSRTLLIAATLMIAGTAFARDHGNDRRNHRGAPGMDFPVIEHLTRAVRHLDLSDEQKEAIHAELKGMREQLKPLVQEMHAGRKDLHGLITADAYAADAVADVAAQQGELTTEITMIASGAAVNVLAQLTDEQRLELQAMGEKRRAHQKERMERDRERMGERPSDG